MAEKTETGDEALPGYMSGKCGADGDVGECSCEARRILLEEELLRSLITRCLTGGMTVFIDAGTPNVCSGADGPGGAPRWSYMESVEEPMRESWGNDDAC